MTWLVIINKKEKIDLTNCYDYEYDDYNYFPDEDGRPIRFENYEDACSWIKENILIEMICNNSSEVRHLAIRSKYLKVKDNE